MRPARWLWAWLLAMPAAQAQDLPGSGQAVEAAWRQAWLAGNAELPPHLNRLVLADSAYLRQHADNPVDWYPWSDAAFARARAENRLVLLSIGYASCHWCHVMERESFADPGLAALVNANMVAVKVDREERPDLDAAYSLVVEAVLGETGWPITIILTPGREPLFAANYLTRDQLATAVERYAGQWRAQPEALRRSAAALATATAAPAGSATDAAPDPQWTTIARDRLLASLDADFGGFGGGPKFPDELKWRYLLDACRESGEEGTCEAVETHLDALLASGLTDPVFGGVFRYTTDREMRRPHFEKMLYNQAQVVSLYAQAADWLDRPDFLAFADEVIAFVDASLRLPGGGLASAVDAEHGGVEGGYYRWPQAALADMPVTLTAVPMGDGTALVQGRPRSAADRAWLSRLAATRPQPPRVTANEITAWNALWMRALVDAGRPAEAAALAEHAWAHAWRGGRLYRLGDQPGYLDDHALFADALWALYLATAEDGWKQRAAALDAALLAGFTGAEGLRYQPGVQPASQDLTVYRDGELPAPAAAALGALSRHPGEAGFLAALDTAWPPARAAIAVAPERHLSLLGAAWPPPGSATLIAQGHGLATLRAGEAAGEWWLELQLDPGWHVNAGEVSEKWLVPTRVTVTEIEAGITYPPGVPFQASFAAAPLRVYGDRARIGITAPPGTRRLAVELATQACNERACLLPERHRLRVAVSVRGRH